MRGKLHYKQAKHVTTRYVTSRICRFIEVFMGCFCNCVEHLTRAPCRYVTSAQFQRTHGVYYFRSIPFMNSAEIATNVVLSATILNSYVRLWKRWQGYNDGCHSVGIRQTFQTLLDGASRMENVQLIRVLIQDIFCTHSDELLRCFPEELRKLCQWTVSDHSLHGFRGPWGID